MKRIDWYIGSSVLTATGMVALVVVALAMVSRFIAEIDKVGDGGYGWLQMSLYVLLKTPSDLLLVLPVVTLLGALLALGSLAAGRELVVLRSAGVSMLRLVGSVSVAGVVLAVIAIALGEYIGPAGNDAADNLQHRARYGTAVQALPDGVWLRHGDTIVRVGGMVAGTHITDIDIYRMDDQGHLLTAIHASRGRLGDGAILLQQPQITRITTTGTQVRHPAQLRVAIALGPEVLKLAAVDPNEQTSLALWRYISYLGANDINAGDYRLALWRNILTPFTIWLLTVFALPFAFGSLRSAGSGQRLFLGGLLGLLFYLADQIIGATGMVYGLPPWLAASLPTLLLGAGTAYWVRRVN